MTAQLRRWRRRHEALGALFRMTLAATICVGTLSRQVAAQDSIDKSRFTLFNPTPADAMRPFSTDRPGKTHSALTVDAGHFQIESDIGNYTWDYFTKDKTTIRAFTIVSPNFKIGIANWAELDIIIPLYNRLNVKDRTNGSVVRASGFGDIL